MENSKVNWFHRIKEGITTSTREKKEAPDGIWHKCPGCKATSTSKELKENLWVCPECGFHNRIGSEEYFEIFFDDNKYLELFTNLSSRDFLKFTDLKSYEERIEQTQENTGLKDAIQVAAGKVNEIKMVIASMDFNFIGGSMGSVVGEKISLAIDYSLEKKLPLLIISKSGGARMMEGAYSLMQLAKTASKLTLLCDAKIPYISLLTDPTTGGVTASFAMLGDLIVAEPGALIGFAGPRVIKETIKRDLPDGFQRSEFLLEHGFLDMIIPRSELKQKFSGILNLLKH